MRHRSRRLSSRAIVLGTRSGGWGRAGLLALRCDSPAACSGVVEGGLPPRAAAIRDRELARLAYVQPDCLLFASWPLGLPVPLLGPRGRERARTPRALNRVKTKPPCRWGNADRSPAPAPQSKPVTPASRLVARSAPLVAFGLGPRILATGPATYRHYSYCGVCGRIPKFVATCHEPGSSFDRHRQLRLGAHRLHPTRMRRPRRVDRIRAAERRDAGRLPQQLALGRDQPVVTTLQRQAVAVRQPARSRSRRSPSKSRRRPTGRAW